MKFMSSAKQSKVQKKEKRSVPKSNNYVSETGIFFKKSELQHYINLLTGDEHHIFKFLEYDCCNRLADNYLLAMVFVYFKRSGLSVGDYSYTNFFAGLLLAHALVEENESFIDEINYWALPNCADDRTLVQQLERVKFLMLQAMGYRAAVSQPCLKAVMSAVTHPIWSRKRDSVHAGTAFKSGLRHFPGERLEHVVNSLTASCEKCRRARNTLLFGCHRK